MPVKAHAFGDLKKLNLEPYVTLRALPPHWGATQFPNINPEFSIRAQKRGYPIFGSSPSYSDTQLIPKQVGPHPWELHSSTMRRLQGAGCPAPHWVGGACGHQDHTTPPSPWSLHWTSIVSPPLQLHSPRLPWITSSQNPKLLQPLFAPSFSFTFDSLIGLTFLKLLLPALWHYHLESPLLVTTLL